MPTLIKRVLLILVMPPFVRRLVQILATLMSPMLDPKAQVAIAAVGCLIILDMLVGVLGAIMTKTFSSEKMRSGLLHKFTELICIATAIILDGALIGGADISIQPILMTTCVYIGVMETGSILELVKRYNPDAEGLVGWLTSFVQQKGANTQEVK